MDNLLYLRLEAHNPARNHHRKYEVRLGRDLFERWVVTLAFGRDGKGGHQLCYSDDDRGVIREIIRESLSRRSSSPRRIGCEYRVTELSAAAGLAVRDWLPAGFGVPGTHIAHADTTERPPVEPAWVVEDEPGVEISACARYRILAK